MASARIIAALGIGVDDLDVLAVVAVTMSPGR